jgi:hypothetical protein
MINISLKKKINLFNNFEVGSRFFSVSFSVSEKTSAKRFRVDSIIIKYSDFNSDKFIFSLMNNLLINNTYTIFLTIGFLASGNYYIINRQVGIIVKNNHEISRYLQIYDVYDKRISEMMLEYSMNVLPDIVKIDFKLLNLDSNFLESSEEKKNLSLSKLMGSKNHVEGLTSSSYFPLTRSSIKSGILYDGVIKLELLKSLIDVVKNSVLKLGLNLLENKSFISQSRVYKKQSKNKKYDYILIESSFSNLRLLNLDESSLNFLGFNNFLSLKNEGRVGIAYILQSGDLVSKIIDVFNDESE